MSSNQQYDDLNPQMKAVEDGKHHLDKHDQTAGLQHFDDHYVLDAMITGISTENSDDYEVSIYESGYLSTATRTGISAYAMHAGDWFSIGERVKVKLRTEDNTGWILHEPQPQLGIIVPNGPNGEPARKDRFYHVELAYYSDSDNIPPNTMGTFSGDLDRIVLAENLGEPANPDDSEAIDDQGSHNIPTGTPVLLMWNWDQAQGAADGDINENNEAEPNTKRPNRRWFFYHAPTTYAGTFDCKADEDPENSDNPPVETQNITRIDFDNDDFDFRVIKNNRDQDYPDTAYINWLGFDINLAQYGEEDISHCRNKIIRFDIDSTAASEISAGTYHTGKTPYEVEWFMNSDDMRRACLSDSECTGTANFTTIFGTVWVPNSSAISVGTYDCFQDLENEHDGIKRLFFFENDFIAAYPDSGNTEVELVKWRGMEMDAYGGDIHCNIKAMLFDQSGIGGEGTSYPVEWTITTDNYNKSTDCGCAESVVRLVVKGHVTIPTPTGSIGVGTISCVGVASTSSASSIVFNSNDFGVTEDTGQFAIDWIGFGVVDQDDSGACDFHEIKFDGPSVSLETPDSVDLNFEVAVGGGTPLCIGSGCDGQQAVVTGKAYGVRTCFVSDVSCDPDTGEMVITKKSAIMFDVGDCE